MPRSASLLEASHGQRQVSLRELSRHNKKDDAWISLDGVVYDATPFLERHPGGACTLVNHAGQDISPFFDGFHSDRARTMLQDLPVVGRLKEKPRARKAATFIAPIEAGGTLANFTVYDPSKKRVVHAVGRDRRVPLEVDRIHEEFRAWVKGDDTFPCIAGKMAIVGLGSYGLGVYHGKLGDGTTADELLADLRIFMRYQSAQWKAGNHFTTFVAIFPDMEDPKDKEAVDLKLVRELLALDKADDAARDGITDQEREFLIVGLHPKADRRSRRFSHPALVFNSAEQFEHLDQTGQMPAIQDAVRRRDKKISGNILVNPALPMIKLGIPKGA